MKKVVGLQLWSLEDDRVLFISASSTVHMCTDVNDVAGQEYPLFQRVFLGLVPNAQPSRAAHPTDATPDGRSSHRQRRSHRSRDGLPESYIRPYVY